MRTSGKNRPIPRAAGPLLPLAGPQALFETCERRLVLSAQLMFDLLGDQALELHGDVALVSHSDAVPIESHLKEAHAASGWNTVQQQFGLTGKGQTVAVIDSGIAWDHVALGRGFGPGYRVVGGWDFTEENDANPYDDGPLGFHGTHVAGIIGSDDPNHPGVAPDVDLVALRVFNDTGQGQLSWVERALQWVHANRNTFENPISTVNLSLGTSWNADVIPNWATLEEELQVLATDGIVVTASAGNSFQQYLTSGLSYPAASPYVLPVASVDDQGHLSDFSQRNNQVIAAPGERILSTVPDHVLGRDGRINDFTSASGTSMAAPYVAGASVLVRQAMEMVDYAGINLTSITNHLRDTADTVFDSVTGANYPRLNLQRAIDSLIPDDSVGNDLPTATQLSLTSSPSAGWINTIGDQDVYRFTPAASGTLRLDANSEWLESLRWSIQAGNGQPITSGGLDSANIPIMAGQTYHLVVSSSQEIGPFSFDVGFTADSSGNSGGQGNSAPPSGNPINLGQIHYVEQVQTAGKLLRVQASQDGLFSVEWTNHDAPSGSLSVFKPGVSTISDSTWSNGTLRVDVEVAAGQWLDIQLPGQSTDQGELAIANAVSRIGSNLTVTGGLGSDQIAVDLQNGLKVRFGDIEYAYPNGAVKNLVIDAHGGNDSLTVVGSLQSDKVDLRPTGSTIENSQIQIAIASMEEVNYHSGGGADRVYLYDSDGDDTLTARPRSAELVGVGYKFSVQEVERIFIHATGGGQDFAYLYDSSGDDRLSVRPQFSSISGNGFFNYVRGFERVYAYANAGGFDQADLYDSAGNDRFNTSGASASIVGPGFSSFTRSFEQVNAYSEAGGSDSATLYGSNSQTQWQQGSDFIRFREDGLTREARGFGNVETYVAGQTHGLTTESFASLLGSMPAVLDVGATSDYHSTVAPPIDAYVGNTRISSFDTHVSSPSLFAAELVRLNEVDSESETNQIVQDSLPEMQLLHQTRHLADWLSERLVLPEEELLDDPDLELALLDEIFSRHSL